MADLSITAANVAKQTGASTTVQNAAVTITAGQLLYQDTTVTPNVWRLSNAVTSATTGQIQAVALNAAGAGQPVVGLTGGPITIGATVVAGQIYVASTNSGAIAPVSDLAASSYTCVLGVASNTTTIQVSIYNSGVVHG